LKQLIKKLSLVIALTFAISALVQALPLNKAEASTVYSYYAKVTSSLYNSTKSNKKKIATVPVNAKLSTTTSKSSKMYKVKYNGKSGYVYAANLSSKRVTLTFYVKTTSSFYNNTSSKKKKLDTIPVNMKLTTTSVKTDKMYKVSYNGKSGYVYAANLSTKKLSSVPFGQTVRVGNFTVKIDKPKNEYGESYLEDGKSKYIAVPITIKNFGSRDYAGYISELYINNKYYDGYDIQYYSTKYDELDTLVELSKGKTLSGIQTFKVSPGKKLEIVYSDFWYDNTITFTGKN